jgi:coproporphyrinogen III oxidase-like Fe-S oxidoreductase
MAKEKIHDVIVNMDIMLGVPSKSAEEAYDKVEAFSTEKLLTIALEQLPFNEMEGAGINFIDGHIEGKLH